LAEKRLGRAIEQQGLRRSLLSGTVLSQSIHASHADALEIGKIDPSEEEGSLLHDCPTKRNRAEEVFELRPKFGGAEGI
jgi:hypothetical protein